MLNKITRTLGVALATLTIASCDKNDTTPTQPYDDGVFVINQGNFFDNNGSLSLLQRNSKTASTDIFMKENARSFAGGITDYTEANEKGIVLIDNSTDGQDAIEIVDARTFKATASIKGEIDNPRKAVMATTNKVYITCWDTFNADYSFKTGFVAVLDLTTNKITKRIPVDKGVEAIVVVGSNAYVGSQKTIKVIDITKDEVTATIEVGANPSNFVLDASNKIWMTLGNEIILFNPNTKLVETKLKAGAINTNSSGTMVISQDKKTLYYTYGTYGTGEVKSIDISTGVSKTFSNRAFASVGFDPESNQVYTTLIPSYKQAGYIFRYQTTGVVIDSVKAEIAPSGFFFK